MASPEPPRDSGSWRSLPNDCLAAVVDDADVVVDVVVVAVDAPVRLVVVGAPHAS